MMVRVSRQFEKQDTSKRVIGIPRMMRSDAFVFAVGFLISSQSIMFNIIHSFQKKETEGCRTDKCKASCSASECSNANQGN